MCFCNDQRRRPSGPCDGMRNFSWAAAHATRSLERTLIAVMADWRDAGWISIVDHTINLSLEVIRSSIDSDILEYLNVLNDQLVQGTMPNLSCRACVPADGPSSTVRDCDGHMHNL